MSLKDKILELVSRPNCCRVIFEHESYGVYFCTCYIDDGQIIYKGCGKDENTSFEQSYKNMLTWKELQISLNEFHFKAYDYAEIIKKDKYRIAVLLDSKRKRKIIREIDLIDEDGFIIWDTPGLLKDFCINHNIEFISSNNTISLYRYTTKINYGLCGAGGFIKVDTLTNKIIASKMEWMS